MAVHLIPNRRDVAALLLAEQVSRAAQLEVAHRDSEACAEHRELLDRVQALHRLVLHGPVLRQEKVAVRAVLPAPDAAAQLVKLGEAEHVRVVDDHRVRGRDVDSRLDDRGRDEDVGLAAHEAQHRVLELLRRHLAVADRDARAGREALDVGRDREEVADPVVDEEDLTLARELALQRLLDAPLVVRDHLGHDRAAVGGRGRERADVAQAEHRHVQRARDRRRREREDIGGDAELEEARLVLDAEALLLVDDDEADVLEDDILRQEPVRADDDIDLAARERIERRLLLGVGLEAAHALDAERIRAEPLAEAALVLLAEDRRRHEHRDLPARVDRLERGADRDLGLAEADIAADEAIHRPRALHVALGRGDRGDLVLGLLVRELRLELALPVAVGGVRDALRRRARGLDAQQLAREVACAFLGVFLRLLPAPAAEGRQPRTRRARADIALDELDARRGHMDLGALVELEREELLHAARAEIALARSLPVAREQLEPDEARDAVVAVHHIVAGLEGEERVLRASARKRAPASTHGRAVEDLARRHDHEARAGRFQHEAARDMRDRPRDAVGGHRAREQLGDARALGVALAEEDRARAVATGELRELRDRGACVLLEDRQRPRTELLRAAARGPERVQLDRRARASPAPRSSRAGRTRRDRRGRGPSRRAPAR